MFYLFTHLLFSYSRQECVSITKPEFFICFVHILSLNTYKVPETWVVSIKCWLIEYMLDGQVNEYYVYGN
jgi:hypothetical protein